MAASSSRWSRISAAIVSIVCKLQKSRVLQISHAVARSSAVGACCIIAPIAASVASVTSVKNNFLIVWFPVWFCYWLNLARFVSVLKHFKSVLFKISKMVWRLLWVLFKNATISKNAACFAVFVMPLLFEWWRL